MTAKILHKTALIIMTSFLLMGRHHLCKLSKNSWRLSNRQKAQWQFIVKPVWEELDV
jgi:hypothetical protein